MLRELAMIRQGEAHIHRIAISLVGRVLVCDVEIVVEGFRKTACCSRILASKAARTFQGRVRVQSSRLCKRAWIRAKSSGVGRTP